MCLLCLRQPCSFRRRIQSRICHISFRKARFLFVKELAKMSIFLCRHPDRGGGVQGPRPVCVPRPRGGRPRRGPNGHRGPQLHHQGRLRQRHLPRLPRWVTLREEMRLRKWVFFCAQILLFGGGGGGKRRDDLYTGVNNICITLQCNWITRWVKICYFVPPRSILFTTIGGAAFRKYFPSSFLNLVCLRVKVGHDMSLEKVHSFEFH